MGFSADMIANAKPMFDSYAEEINKPPEQQDAGKIAQLRAGIIQTFTFAPLAAAHGLSGKVRAPGARPEIAPPPEVTIRGLPEPAKAPASVKRPQLYRGTTLEQWQAIQRGEQPQSEFTTGGNTWATTSLDSAKGYTRSEGKNAVIIEYKDSAHDKVTKLTDDPGDNRRQGPLRLDDVQRVTDGEGNIIYEAKAPAVAAEVPRPAAKAAEAPAKAVEVTDPQKIADQIGMRFDKQEGNFWMFTPVDKNGVDSTTLTMPAGTPIEEVKARYEATRAKFGDQPGAPRPMKSEAPKESGAIEIKDSDLQPLLGSERKLLKPEFVDSIYDKLENPDSWLDLMDAVIKGKIPATGVAEQLGFKMRSEGKESAMPKLKAAAKAYELAVKKYGSEVKNKIENADVEDLESNDGSLT